MKGWVFDHITGEATEIRDPLRVTHLDPYKWIRLFNRLEKAVSRHEEAKEWTDDADDALHAAWRRILKDAGPK